MKQRSNEELDALGNPDKRFRLQVREVLRFEPENREEPIYWMHHKCYRTKGAMQRARVALESNYGSWMNYSNDPPVVILWRREYRERVLPGVGE